MKDYKISVITPIYNVEETLEETISSVIGQTIGFDDNIQLILVNDGSPDNSYRICDKYAELYPDNVVYISKENGGVSSARNEGLAHITGKYVVFLDGDDTWEDNAFQNIYDFFENSSTPIDVCCCKIEHTGDFKGRKHVLDFRFDKGKRVVDLSEEPDMVSSTIGNTAFRASAISGRRFTTTISVGEDAEFTNSVLLDNPHLGILPEAVFYYRRNFAAGSGSSSAPNRKSWYLDVPRDYYLSLCNKSVDKYGKVLPFIQYVILYDMRWRHYNKKMMDVLTEEEKKQHLELMHQVMSNVDTDAIYAARGYSQHQRLYLMDLKYGKEVIKDAEQVAGRFYYDGQQLINLHGSKMLDVKVFDVRDDVLTLEGIIFTYVIKQPQDLYVRDDKGNRYPLELRRYDQSVLRGYVGEMITDAQAFSVKVPVHDRIKLGFYDDTGGQTVRLRPIFPDYIGFVNYTDHNYCLKGGYIIKNKKGRISFYKYNKKTMFASEARLSTEILRKKGLSKGYDRLKKVLFENKIRNSKLKNQVAFISVRSDGELNGNIKCVYDALDLPKSFIAKKNLYKDKEKTREATELIFSSKVVVTDDYVFLFRDYDKKPGQYYVQLWHATGAGKKFGKDGGPSFPAFDSLYHRDYDLVTVSGEASRVAFASAFNIPVERLQNVGVARTDMYFDEEQLKQIRERIYEKYPNLAGKQVILYSPTFRDRGSGTKSTFRPPIDFAKLSEDLLPNQVLVLTPHPVMTEPIVRGDYDNVLEIRDIPTGDMMIASDMLITDYSSVMFEYALLRKPMGFFCYDYDDYDRDFYMDFDNELPGPLLRTQEELTEYLRQDEHPLMDDFENFYNKYMGACDGHSTERIVALIKEMFYN